MKTITGGTCETCGSSFVQYVHTPTLKQCEECRANPDHRQVGIDGWQ